MSEISYGLKFYKGVGFTTKKAGEGWRKDHPKVDSKATEQEKQFLFKLRELFRSHEDDIKDLVAEEKQEKKEAKVKAKQSGLSKPVQSDDGQHSSLSFNELSQVSRADMPNDKTNFISQ